jgi:hypothetical protein
MQRLASALAVTICVTAISVGAAGAAALSTPAAYAALGDSYTSGPFITHQTCHRLAASGPTTTIPT